MMRKADNFMAYFYLYRGKLRQRILAKIAQDNQKKLDDKNVQLTQSKANEVELLNKIREENSGQLNIKSSLTDQMAKIEALEQEKYFLFQELVNNTEKRPRTSSYNFVVEEQPLEKINERLIEENKEMSMHIEELNKRVYDLEEEDMRKTSEIRLNKKLLNSSKSMTIGDVDGGASPMRVAPADVCRKLVETQHENEE